MKPCLLALDTSTESMALAVLAPSGLHTRVESGGAQSSARLVPATLALLAEAGVAPSALDAVAFGQGPGAFTGLRTACAVAQGLAFGLDKPVLGIDSLMILAEDLAAEGECWVAIDARMDEVYAAAYRRDAAGHWRATVAPRLYTLEALAAAWRAAPPALIAGNAIEAFAGRLPVGAAHCHPRPRDRAAALGRLALAAWEQGLALPADQALPLYLRDKVALTTAERAAAAAAAAP